MSPEALRWYEKRPEGWRLWRDHPIPGGHEVELWNPATKLFADAMKPTAEQAMYAAVVKAQKLAEGGQ